ncbi:hypothetical protein V502_04216 [Pseudogymnoascus sp. VKM F-4520 (FW-2644)]|nr:hypothetical protein V502_04216 [Pseudogymnoascus sp. VKM F-4520 (FW-2644)]
MQFQTLLAACFALFITVSCASPPSFCKCTCFTNSTIIELTPKTTSQKSSNLLNRFSPNPPASLERRAASSADCSQCNRAFCIAQNLPICKNAEEKDIFTTCFQRDSRKDQIIVLAFICTTLGLLGWAAGSKVLEKRRAGGPGLFSRSASRRDDQGVYAPVNNE